MKHFLLCILAVAVAAGCANRQKKDNVTETEDLDAQYATELLAPGTAAPDFTLGDLRGKERSLSEFRGRKVVLVFWASWCPDCRAELPRLKALQAAADPAKVAFVNVSYDRDFDTLCSFVDENGLGGIQLFDPAGKKDSKAGADYHVKWIPSLYLIGEDGKVELATVMIEKIAAALEGSGITAALSPAARQGLCEDESCAL